MYYNNVHVVVVVVWGGGGGYFGMFSVCSSQFVFNSMSWVIHYDGT